MREGSLKCIARPGGPLCYPSATLLPRKQLGPRSQIHDARQLSLSAARNGRRNLRPSRQSHRWLVPRRRAVDSARYSASQAAGSPVSAGGFRTFAECGALSPRRPRSRGLAGFCREPMTFLHCGRSECLISSLRSMRRREPTCTFTGAARRLLPIRTWPWLTHALKARLSSSSYSLSSPASRAFTSLACSPQLRSPAPFTGRRTAVAAQRRAPARYRRFACRRPRSLLRLCSPSARPRPALEVEDARAASVARSSASTHSSRPPPTLATLVPPSRPSASSISSPLCSSPSSSPPLPQSRA